MGPRRHEDLGGIIVTHTKSVCFGSKRQNSSGGSSSIFGTTSQLDARGVREPPQGVLPCDLWYVSLLRETGDIRDFCVSWQQEHAPSSSTVGFASDSWPTHSNTNHNNTTININYDITRRSRQNIDPGSKEQEAQRPICGALWKGVLGHAKNVRAHHISPGPARQEARLDTPIPPRTHGPKPGLSRMKSARGMGLWT